MSGDLWQMARNGTTLLPSEVKKLAADYDRLRRILAALREPSEAVKIAVQEAVEREALAPCYYREVEQIVRAAVAAAEKEA